MYIYIYICIFAAPSGQSGHRRSRDEFQIMYTHPDKIMYGASDQWVGSIWPRHCNEEKSALRAGITNP